MQLSSTAHSLFARVVVDASPAYFHTDSLPTVLRLLIDNAKAISCTSVGPIVLPKSFPQVVFFLHVS